MTKFTHLPRQPRRDFLKQAGAMALATSATAALQTSPVLAANAPQKTAESLVTVLYESLTDKQKKEVCFDWNFVEKKRGLLRTRLENNWKITKPSIKSSFYTKEQQHLAHQIFRGMTHPDWYSRFDQQLKDDVGGFGNKQSLAIFGKPGSDKFEFVLASRWPHPLCPRRGSFV